MAKERIGILGGTFDPIHQGHIKMAISVLDSCKLDRLLVLPSGHPAYKSSVTSREDRWKMVVIACTQDSRLLPSRLELDRNGPYAAGIKKRASKGRTFLAAWIGWNAEAPQLASVE